MIINVNDKPVKVWGGKGFVYCKFSLYDEEKITTAVSSNTMQCRFTVYTNNSAEDVPIPCFIF